MRPMPPVNSGFSRNDEFSPSIEVRKLGAEEAAGAAELAASVTDVIGEDGSVVVAVVGADVATSVGVVEGAATWTGWTACAAVASLSLFDPNQPMLCE